MQWLVEIGLSNALVAVVLAMVAWAAGRVLRRPAVTHALCLLVLLKLLTPPIIELPLPLPIARTAADGSGVASPAAASMRQRHANQTEATEPPAFAVDGPAKELAPLDADQPVFGAPRRAEIAQVAGPRTTTGAASALPVGAINSNSLADDVPDRPAALSRPPIPYNNIPWTRLGRIFVVVWIIGTAAWFALQLVLGLRMAAILGQSAPPPAELVGRASQMAHRMGLGRSPRLRVVSAATSPMLCGLGHRASIVLPEALLGRLSPEGLDTVLAHELAHFRRKDQWVRLLELIATGLYWWHPVVWWVRQRIETAEEQCCDALVLRACRARPRVYAEAILEIVDLISGAPNERLVPRRLRPVMSSGMGHAPPLTNRLRDLMEGRCVPTMTPLGKRIILVAGALCLFYHPTFFITEAPSARAASVARLDRSRRLSEALPVREEVERQAAPTTKDPSAPINVPALPTHAEADALQSAAEETTVAPWATAISPNGRYQIVARPGYSCELREVISGRTRQLGADPITCVAFAPHSGAFATGDLAGTVRLWDAASGETLQVLAQRDNAVYSVAFSPIGDRIALAGEDGVVEVVDFFASPDEPRFAREIGAPIRCVRFSPDGDLLAVAIDSWRNTGIGSVMVYEIDSQMAVHQWNVEGPVGAVQFEPDGNLLVVEWSGRVVRWHVPGFVPVGTSSIAKDLVSAASFSADTRALEAAMDNVHP